MTTNRLPVSRLNGDGARDNARNFSRDPNSPSRYRLCLAFVRGDCWNIPAKALTAHAAWDDAVGKVKYDGSNLDKWADRIPVGAPVFSRKPGASDDDPWHVFIACGWHRDAKNRRLSRIFRSVDIKGPGDVDACTIHAFVNKWGHEIVGYTRDLNGVRLRLTEVK